MATRASPSSVPRTTTPPATAHSSSWSSLCASTIARLVVTATARARYRRVDRQDHRGRVGDGADTFARAFLRSSRSTVQYSCGHPGLDEASRTQREYSCLEACRGHPRLVELRVANAAGVHLPRGLSATAHSSSWSSSAGASLRLLRTTTDVRTGRMTPAACVDPSLTPPPQPGSSCRCYWIPRLLLATCWAACKAILADQWARR